MQTHLRRLVAVAIIVQCVASFARAELKVPPLFGENTVLQRGEKVPIWGTAEPKEKVVVSIAGKSDEATADDKGNWKAELKDLPVGGPYTLQITGAGGTPLLFKNVLVGDVWLCSGQSNMDWAVAGSNDHETEIAGATDAEIRLYQFPHTAKIDPSHEVRGEWKVTSPESIPGFSAVGYFFGRELRKMHPKVPIGLIQCAWGGMPAEAFTSKEMLETRPDFKPLLQRKEDAKASIDTERADWKNAAEEWQKDVIEKDMPDITAFAGPEINVDEWKPLTAPQPWENAGNSVDGFVWLRKEIDVPAQWAGKDLMLSLGRIDDLDITYFNGVKVGSTGAENPLSVFVNREYTVTGNLVKPGKNVIAVRVFDGGQNGGFVGDAKIMFVKPVMDKSAEPISLAAEWGLKVEKAIDPKTLPPRPTFPNGPDGPNFASNIFNGQILPLVPYAVSGAIWYQGESNAGRAEQYRTLFPAMIEDWREQWDVSAEKFPFLFVQLANFKDAKPQPADSDWAELREAQLMTLDKVKNTGMAVIIDIGEAKNIHPKNKQDVGKRLAIAAEHLAYGNKEIVYSGPIYKSMDVHGDKIKIEFDHVGGGLKARDGDELKGFAIAGEDKKFVWATATIDKDGDEVIVSSPDVKDPKAVRYAWADNPDTANLVNAEGLPASPFRTDDWKMVTAGKW